MKTLGRYILLEFLKLLVISMLSFLVLFLMIDLFENMNGILKNNVPFWQALMFFAFKVPFIVCQVTPVAVLLSVLLSLGILSRHGEITAIKAGGVRLVRVLLPLFAAGAMISAAVVAVNESVTLSGLKRAEAFRKTWLGAGPRGSFGAGGVWLRTPEGIMNIRQIDLKKKEVQGVNSFIIAKPFTLKARVLSRRALWRDGRWVAQDVTTWNISDDGKAASSTARAAVIEGPGPPEELAGVEDTQKNMTVGELYRYVKNLEADGYEAYRYRTDLYGRFTFPVVSFIMVFVGIPFALKTGRTGGIAVGVGLSVVIAFSYWIIFAASRSLGINGVIPPILAASFPDILFLAAGALMLGYVRQ